MKNNIGWQVYDDDQQQQEIAMPAAVKQHRAAAACIHTYIIRITTVAAIGSVFFSGDMVKLLDMAK